MDSGRHSCMPMHRLWPSAGCGPVRGLVCAVSARRCECQRQLQRALPVVHTCDSDYSHSTGEHVLVRDGTRRNGSSVEMASSWHRRCTGHWGTGYPVARHCSIPGRHASAQRDIIALSTNKRWRACTLSIECASDTFVVRWIMLPGAHICDPGSLPYRREFHTFGADTRVAPH